MEEVNFFFLGFVLRMGIEFFFRDFLKVFGFLEVDSVLRFFRDLFLFFCLIRLVIFKIFCGLNWNLLVDGIEVIFFIDLFFGVGWFVVKDLGVSELLGKYFLKMVFERIFWKDNIWFFGVGIGLLGLLFLLLVVRSFNDWRVFYKEVFFFELEFVIFLFNFFF